MMNLQITHTVNGKNPQTYFIAIDNDTTFEKFKNLVSSLTKTKLDTVRYEDEDGDIITVESEPEFEEFKKLGARQQQGFFKVLVDASPFVVQKPKPELISFNLPQPVACQRKQHVPLVDLPSTLEVLSHPPPRPTIRVLPSAQPIPLTPLTKPAPAVSPAAPQKPIHNAYCDNCNCTIVGLRWKCVNCHDYDLCEKCEVENETRSIHDSKHVFMKLRTQIRAGHFVPLPNLFDATAPRCTYRREYHHPMPTNQTEGLNQRIAALESKVGMLIAERPAPKTIPAASEPVPAPECNKKNEEKLKLLEERRLKREKAKQEREALKEQRIQQKLEAKQKKIQQKQQKQQKQQQQQQPAAADSLINFGDIPVVLKIEEVESVEPQVQVPVKAETIEAVIEEVEDEFHQQQEPAVVEAVKVEVAVEEVKANQADESIDRIAEEFVQVPKEDEPYAVQLNILKDMGFQDAGVQLSDLLKQFYGDVQAVIQHLLEN